jgi:hypothetical protein
MRSNSLKYFLSYIIIFSTDIFTQYGSINLDEYIQDVKVFEDKTFNFSVTPYWDMEREVYSFQ